MPPPLCHLSRGSPAHWRRSQGRVRGDLYSCLSSAPALPSVQLIFSLPLLYPSCARLFAQTASTSGLLLLLGFFLDHLELDFPHLYQAVAQLSPNCHSPYCHNCPCQFPSGSTILFFSSVLITSRSHILRNCLASLSVFPR